VAYYYKTRQVAEENIMRLLPGQTMESGTEKSMCVTGLSKESRWGEEV
jgi:hypothetical protein